MKSRRLDTHEEALASQLSALGELHERLTAIEQRIAEIAGVQPDDLGRVQALAEDGLARATNAQAIGEDAEKRVAGVEALGVDALARADNAQAIAEDALGRVVEVAAQGVDALARADNAQAIGEDALARVGEVKGQGVDALARAGNAQAIAEDALARVSEVGGQGVDALARAGNAQAIAEDALGRVVEVAAQGVDALARAANAQAIAEDAVARAAEAESQGQDAVARAGNAQRLADQGLRQAAAAQGQGEDALAGARQAASQADEALQRAASAAAQAADAEARATLALDAAHEALLPARMAAFGSWLELCPPAEGPAISVVLATRDRPALLPRAIASLFEQRYERWQLVVVDDGDTDAVAETLAGLVDDSRIVVAEGPRRGLGAARNAGLEAATGEVACYLDDDNVMHPLWLGAVAHVFARREDVDVAYGVTLAEHREPGAAEPAAWWPSLWQLPWSREKLLDENLADAGALAHRRELPEARFDEQLPTGEDWDLLLRLTVDRPALAIPALSHAYTLSAGGRMSQDPAHAAGLEEIRRRHAER